jgi:hypothetical protein
MDKSVSAVIKLGTIITLFLALACCACFQKPRQQLVVGMELNYPPFAIGYSIMTLPISL